MKEYSIERENKITSGNGTEFFISHYETADGAVVPHIHSSMEMLFIAKGRFRVFSENREFIVEEGDTVLFRPNTIHRIYATESDSFYYVLKMHPSFILANSSHECGSSYLLRLSIFHDNVKIVWDRKESQENGLAWVIENLAREWDKKQYAQDIAIKAYANQALLIVMRELEKYDDGSSASLEDNENLSRRIYDAVIYINKRYAEDISALDCSKELFMSYSYFSRSFKRITGKSFSEYLLNVRINRAEKALLSTQKSVTEIAFECGFNSAAHFSAIYKKIKGVTPSVARRAASAENQ